MELQWDPSSLALHFDKDAHALMAAVGGGGSSYPDPPDCGHCTITPKALRITLKNLVGRTNCIPHWDPAMNRSVRFTGVVAAFEEVSFEIPADQILVCQYADTKYGSFGSAQLYGGRDCSQLSCTHNYDTLIVRLHLSTGYVTVFTMYLMDSTGGIEEGPGWCQIEEFWPHIMNAAPNNFALDGGADCGVVSGSPFSTSQAYPFPIASGDFTCERIM